MANLTTNHPAIGAIAAFSAWCAAICALASCGTDEKAAAAAAAAGPTSLRTAQEPLPQSCTDKVVACWDTEVKKNGALPPVAGAVTLPFQAAGFVLDADGNRLTWAEFAASPTAPRSEISVVWGLCKVGATGNSGCTAGTASYTATGAKILDATGQPIARIGLGLPVLRKALKFHSADKDPTLLAPLEQPFKIDVAVAKLALAAAKPATRRLVVFNAYGPQVGLSADPLVAAATKLGIFDSIEVIDFVRLDDVVAVLPTLTPLDAVVWIGAGVQEKFTDKSEKPLGITVSHGVFGDALVYGKTLGNLLSAPPLGGPGLVILAGSNTLAVPYFADKSTLGAVLNGAPGRATVGFGGKVTPEQALTATAALLTKLAGGSDLQAAMDGMGQPVLSPMDSKTRAKWLFPGKKAAFWGGKAPSKASMTLHISMDPPSCTFAIDPCDLPGWLAAYAQNPIAPEKLTASHATFICQSLVFDGPYFSCQAKDASSTADFSLQGAMRGHGVGDRFWLVAQGTANRKFKQMFVVAEGAIENVDVGGGKTTMQFRGIADAGPYVDQDGNCCAVGSPKVATIKNEPGVFEIWP